jgi:hypothetical protein
VFSDFCSSVKWQAFRKKEFVMNVVLTLRNQLQKAFYGDAMSTTQPLIGIYILEMAVDGLMIWNGQIIHCQD